MRKEARLKFLNQSKTDIKAASKTKGVTIADTLDFPSYGSKISTIKIGAVIKNQDITVTENGTYKCDAGYTGLGKVTVDIPIIEDEEPIEMIIVSPRELSEDGTWSLPTTPVAYEKPEITNIGVRGLQYAMYNFGNAITSVSFPNLKSVDQYGLSYTFYACTGITSINFPELETIANYGLVNAFQTCRGITEFVFPKLSSMGTYALQNAFNTCTGLTEFSWKKSFPSMPDKYTIKAFEIMGMLSSCTYLLKADMAGIYGSTGNQTLYQLFNGCTRLEQIDFPDLEELDGMYAFKYAFQNCKALTKMEFPKLRMVNSQAFHTAFGGATGLKEIWFPELVEVKGTNVFTSMLTGVTGCTVHFRADMEEVLKDNADVMAGFAGTDTVVLFDIGANKQPETYTINATVIDSYSVSTSYSYQVEVTEDQQEYQMPCYGAVTFTLPIDSSQPIKLLGAGVSNAEVEVGGTFSWGATGSNGIERPTATEIIFTRRAAPIR